MSARKAAFVHSAELERFKYPPECPFNVNRAAETRKIINSMGLLAGSGRTEVAPQPPETTVLEKFHSERYLQALNAAAKGKWDVEALRMGIGGPDCPVFADMYDYSTWACSATLTGAELLLSGEADVAFNPSGGLHHAAPEKASGFCYMNDVALGCLVLAEQGKRVLYLDIDVHYGDGVANAFYDRSDVMTISIHESPQTLFPGTGWQDQIGTGDGKGYCVNVPLPVATYDQAYMKVFSAVAMPLIQSYNPDVTVLQSGADGLAGDPLAHLCLTNNTHADVVNRLLGLNKPILATGGGGYNVDNTVRAWALVWSVLCGEDSSHDMNLGIGGVMLESTDWQGGLRDREFVIREQQREIVLHPIEDTIENIKKNVFPLHGL